VKQEVSKYAQYEKMLNDLKVRKEIVDKKRNVIRNLQKDRDVVVRMMALLSVQLPEQEMWFERFTQSGNTITLNGMALSNDAIAEFMRNLEGSPYIEKGTVNLTHSRQVLMSDMKLREFQVTYRFFPFSEVQKTLKAQAS
jgi:type IV pilus assembly protein PilN